MNNFESSSSDTGREAGVWKRPHHLLHYYGDNVRKIFFAIAVITLITLPFFKDFIRTPVSNYIVAMIFLGLVAGFTNPEHRWVALLNVVISIYGILFFELEAISAFGFYEQQIWYFWTNQLLAFLFLTALYYSAKTERGKWFRKMGNP
ncbi:MAG: hypothetical protein HY432_03160 [Candidatus Liptonbacteria bacterium]|nr:hypothetical protein [Candidatus Liptonbacteria bacterium]